MRLSEAILLSIGAVNNQRYQFFNPDRWEDTDGPCGCVLGTALYSMGLRQKDGRFGITSGGDEISYFRAIEQLWPWTRKNNIATEMAVRHARGGSRESIAAWIATIEPQEESVGLTLLTQEEPAHVSA